MPSATAADRCKQHSSSHYSLAPTATKNATCREGEFASLLLRLNARANRSAETVDPCRLPAKQVTQAASSQASKGLLAVLGEGSKMPRSLSKSWLLSSADPKRNGTLKGKVFTQGCQMHGPSRPASMRAAFVHLTANGGPALIIVRSIYDHQHHASPLSCCRSCSFDVTKCFMLQAN